VNKQRVMNRFVEKTVSRGEKGVEKMWNNCLKPLPKELWAVWTIFLTDLSIFFTCKINIILSFARQGERQNLIEKL